MLVYNSFCHIWYKRENGQVMISRTLLNAYTYRRFLVFNHVSAFGSHSFSIILTKMIFYTKYTKMLFLH